LSQICDVVEGLVEETTVVEAEEVLEQQSVAVDFESSPPVWWSSSVPLPRLERLNYSRDQEYFQIHVDEKGCDQMDQNLRDEHCQRCVMFGHRHCPAKTMLTKDAHERHPAVRRFGSRGFARTKLKSKFKI
jgi:hypothetical protein